jgi:subtilisin-like proprotein convertase family protein
VTITAIPITPARYTNTCRVASSLPDVFPINNVSTVFITALETGAAANPDIVLLPDGGKIPIYPSIITVSNRVGTVVSVSATLVGLSHTFPADLDVLLVGPSGRSVILMSDVGAGVDVSGLTLRFDDTAGGYLATNGPLVSGTYKPTDAGGDDTFSAPAPAGPYGATLGVFQGTNPNGDWKLFVMDDQGSDGGVLAGGWQVNIASAGGGAGPEMSAGLEGTDIVLRWPADQPGFVVESSDLSEPLTWTQITFADPPVVGGFFEVRVPVTAGARYFRLRQM